MGRMIELPPDPVPDPALIRFDAEGGMVRLCSGEQPLIRVDERTARRWILELTRAVNVIDLHPREQRRLTATWATGEARES